MRVLSTLLLAAVPLVASADLRVDATRVVHQDKSPTATRLRVHNTGTQVSLVQVWLDTADSDMPLEQLRTPLIATPPIFRLDAGASRDIHIRAADTTGLPGDRESLLWLNIMDIPARTAASNQHPLEFAMRWRLKVFHRPSGLAGSPDAAAAALRWNVQTNAQGKTLLQATNATPYFVSLAQLILDGQPIPLDASAAQVPPLGRWTQTLSSAPPHRRKEMPLKFVWIDAVGIEHSADGYATLVE